MEPELTIVVRSAHERTEALCQAALRAQTDATIHLIHERPFFVALRKSVELGLDGGREFTLCVDADIVMAPNGLARMIDRLRQHPDAFFTCGYFLDKFYGEPKARGAHLYRTRYLAEALEAVPTSDRIERPETAMKQVLLDRGRQGLNVEDHVLGLHGYGQFFRDIFRTIAARGQKSPEEFAGLMDRFSRKAGSDPDLRVALWALVAGGEGDYSLDAHHWDRRVEELFTASRLLEKEALGAGDSRKLMGLARIVGNVPLGVWRQLRGIRRILG